METFLHIFLRIKVLLGKCWSHLRKQVLIETSKANTSQLDSQHVAHRWWFSRIYGWTDAKSGKCYAFTDQVLIIATSYQVWSNHTEIWTRLGSWRNAFGILTWNYLLEIPFLKDFLFLKQSTQWTINRLSCSEVFKAPTIYLLQIVNSFLQQTESYNVVSIADIFLVVPRLLSNLTGNYTNWEIQKYMQALINISRRSWSFNFLNMSVGMYLWVWINSSNELNDYWAYFRPPNII